MINLEGMDIPCEPYLYASIFDICDSIPGFVLKLDKFEISKSKYWYHVKDVNTGCQGFGIIHVCVIHGHKF